MQPADLARLRQPSDVQLHPDGRRVAFVVSRMDLDADHYERCVWLHDGESARPFTHGPFDAHPRWSPDGRWLAFLRRDRGDDTRPQVVVMAADGGEAATRLTDFPLGATELAWAPDSRRLAVTGATHPPHLVEVTDEDRPGRPRRITELPYRADNAGWLCDRRVQVCVVDREADVRDGHEPTVLLDDGSRAWGPTWHPDGERVLVHSARHEGRERDGAHGLYELPVEGGGAPVEVVAPGMWIAAEYAPDATLWATGLPDVFAWPDNLRPFRVAADGVLDDAMIALDRATTGYEGGRGVVVCDDDSLVTRLEDRGRVHLVARAADGTVTRLLDGDRVVGTFDASRDGRVVVATVSAPDQPGEVVEVRDGVERTLTSLGDAFLRDVVVAPTRHVTFERDGEELDVWVVLPPGTERVPVLLNIHGGPTAQYGFGFFDEWQVYAAAGYGVVATNPRGSSGRGRAFMRAVVGTWTTDDPVDMADLAAVVPAAAERFDRLDPERRGIMGGSYGGMATAWLLGDDDRWDSAVVERALLSWTSFAGTSDIGPYFGRMFVPAHVDDGRDDLPASGDGRDLLAAASPLWRAKDTRTPTLVLHSEGDYRCPVEQADQYFALLRQAGCEAEMVRFPGESHELSRSGSPRHRVERFEAILDWHARHLARPAT